MAKICLFLPGNVMHSFLLGDRWQKMYDEQVGLNAIGASNIPVVISHQGIEYELCPFLLDIHRKYPNILVANAPYSHALLPFVSPKQCKWETRTLTGALPITFFSEFYSPESDFIPTEFFFFLRSQTCSYSMIFGVKYKEGVSDLEVDQMLPSKTISVRYNNRIGIVLEGFDKFNLAWFAFTSIPNQENLNKVIREFEILVADPRKVVVVPMDLEQPYVGSVTGEKIWTIFFDELKRKGLADNIVDIRYFLNEFRESAVPIRRPHRILTKWTSHLVQIHYLQRLARLKPITEKERIIYALASASDLLSSWNRFVMSSNKEPMTILCKDLQGNEFIMSQDHNKPLQEACLAALQSLEKGDRKLADKLAKIEQPTELILRLAEFAAIKGL